MLALTVLLFMVALAFSSLQVTFPRWMWVTMLSLLILSVIFGDKFD